MLHVVKRVPIPVVILLGAAAIGLPWWYWTKDIDFMNSPTRGQLEMIRYKTTASLPKQESLFATRTERPDLAEVQSPIKAPPAIHPGAPQSPAEIDEFRNFAAKGAAAFVELASHLEEQSGNARALLAWERVLDSCQPTEAQQQAAISGVKRLQPLVAPWNIDPTATTPLILEALVPKGASADGLEEVLRECATLLTNKSSGLLKFTSRIEETAAQESADSLISIQIIAEHEGSTSTGLVNLPPASPEVPLSRDGVLAAAYKLIAAQLAAATDFTPPSPISQDAGAVEAISTSVTRLSWLEFGKSLHPPAQKTEAEES